jgi:glucose/arabinose dehydrogenase
MKRLFLLLLMILIVGGGVFAYVYYRQNLASLFTALAPSGVDVNQLVSPAPSGPSQDGPLKIPAGYTLTIFAKDLVNPRVLARDQAGNLLVSVPSEGKVVAIPDKNKDGVADSNITVLSGLNRPHGLAFRCDNNCQLYVAESDSVKVYDYDQESLKATNPKKILDLPDAGFHFTRTILFTPENKLLVSIGSDCNVCDEKDPRRASIFIADSDGSNFRKYASGLRNSVFMTLNPDTREVWATEMGRDLLGDDTPPDEINIIRDGKDYGWPNCYGKNIADTTFNKSANCSDREPSQIDLQAHSAPLGLAFLGEDLLVSFHGSWNRSVPTGYKVVKISKNGQIEDFITGWLTRDNKAVGRPVDIMVVGKNIYISDDKAGVVYLLRKN